MGRTRGDGELIAMTTTPLERVSGSATILAPVLLLASTVAYGTLGEGHGVGAVGGLVQIPAMIAFAVAVVGLARGPSRPHRGPRPPSPSCASPVPRAASLSASTASKPACSGPPGSTRWT